MEDAADGATLDTLAEGVLAEVDAEGTLMMVRIDPATTLAHTMLL
jgi:hypothetical protein